MKIGDQVVCINNGPFFNGGDFRDKGERPVVGKVYTIDGFQYSEQFKVDCYILLELSRNEVAKSRGLLGYWVGRFRPVKKTDISIFENIRKDVEAGKILEIVE